MGPPPGSRISPSTNLGHPARSSGVFRSRALTSLGLLILALIGIATATWHLVDSDVLLPVLVAAMAVTGTGMSLMYADLLGLCLTPARDGISQEAAAASTVIAESIGMVVMTTVAFSWPRPVGAWSSTCSTGAGRCTR